MGSGKGRRGSGGSLASFAANHNASSPHRLQQHGGEGGWQGRVKVLASSTLGGAAREEGGRTIALTEEDFRKSGFRAKDTVVVLSSPRQLIVGRVSPLPSAALRLGGVGLAAASAQSLGCEEGSRVRVRRLSDTAVTILPASAANLVLEAGPPGRAMHASPHAYLERFAVGRKALLARAAEFCAHGVFAREGDLLTVSFEGVPHTFRFGRLRPACEATGGGLSAGTEEGGDGGNALAASLAGLSISEPAAAPAARLGHTVQLPREEGIDHATAGNSSSVTRPEPSSGADQLVLIDKHDISPSPMAVATPSAVGKIAAVLTSTEGDAEAASSVARARLEAFYREHNPEKLDGVSGILAKYEGREEALFAKLEKKYGAGSLRATTSGGNSGRERLVRDGGTPESVNRGTRYIGGGGLPPTPSTGQRNVATPGGGGDEDGVRSWGSGEVLWLISTHTSIELTAEDAPVVAPSEGKAENFTADAASGSGTPLRMGEGSQVAGGDWSSVGGLSSQIQQLREAIELPLRSPEILQRYGVRPPRGVLLHGPPGTGKTTLARAAAKACGCHVIVVNGSELMSRFVGESEGALRQTFTEASRRAPCLIVFDEVDTLCPRRDQANSEAQRRVVSTMLALLDGVDAQEQVVVIACTNRPQALDPALRRPGRLDSEVEVGVPDAAGRAEILRVLLRRVPHAMDDVSTSGEAQVGVNEIASRTHGFVGADLQLLVKEAALQALRRTRGGWGMLSESSDDVKETGIVINSPIGTTVAAGGVGEEGSLPTLTPGDFQAALPLVAPSGLREVAVEVPSVRWEDIGGMEGVKQSLREVVEWPLRHPEAFKRMGMSPPRGVLLYGPPGCSKTLMARALATESGMNFLAVKGPELLSKWLGESERAMQALFKRARAAAPTIIFFDEVDALACKRGGGGEGGAGATERVLTQLLTELDGIQPVKRLVVVAATNRPDVIDPALLRPGRLDRLVYVPPPDTASRREILRLSLAKVPAGGDVDREELARRTEGFSGAEVVALCREASICALEEDRCAIEVQQKHLLEALGQMRPQITKAVLASYASFHGVGK